MKDIHFTSLLSTWKTSCISASMSVTIGEHQSSYSHGGNNLKAVTQWRLRLHKILWSFYHLPNIKMSFFWAEHKTIRLDSSGLLCHTRLLTAAVNIWVLWIFLPIPAAQLSMVNAPDPSVGEFSELRGNLRAITPVFITQLVARTNELCT